MTVRTPAPSIAVATTDSVADYLKRIGRTPLLDAEREVALARQIEAGLYAQERLDTDHALDAAARADLEWLAAAGRTVKQHMIEANLRLVVSVAKRYAATGVPLPDLIQEGNCGLIRAVEKFDHERGFKFSTYAMWWIKQAVQRAVDETSRTIRVPAHMAELIAKVDRTSRRLERDLGRAPTAAEIGAELDLTAEKVTRVQGYDRRPVSLHTPIGSEGDGELGDIIEDTVSTPVADQVADAGLRAELDRVLADLTEREAEVVTLRFGLAGDGEPRTFEEIGRHFGLTRERIRQIEVKAMAKLRRESRASVLRDYLG
ncbi:sigma-70 family RNA polymerase sigma factor [Yinghuangia sp. YIM S09857]|uniref:sigma-70 family RNA polymerase sigma factor n=1 Tax=Yinghuangia sp. YIM S09857 TaxID=3436929 RepID=UPI003F53296F